MSKLMIIRAGVIMVSDGKIALIRRVKAKRTYYVVPGGGVEEGEYTYQAARREDKEELGLDVILKRLVAVVERVKQGAITHVQLYYSVQRQKVPLGRLRAKSTRAPKATERTNLSGYLWGRRKDTAFTRALWLRIWLGMAFPRKSCISVNVLTIQPDDSRATPLTRLRQALFSKADGFTC